LPPDVAPGFGLLLIFVTAIIASVMYAPGCARNHDPAGLDAGARMSRRSCFG
jgi:hypothetical protein